MISIMLPSFGRRDLTRRAIMSLAQQTVTDFELFFIGDGCSEYRSLLADDTQIRTAITTLRKRGAQVVLGDLKEHTGSPAAILNWGISRASREYVGFFANDDVLMPTHIENYVTGAVRNHADLTLFDLLYVSQQHTEIILGTHLWHGGA
jgi:glycosyltransferase involved in cell wall biosynthesis